MNLKLYQCIFADDNIENFWSENDDTALCEFFTLDADEEHENAMNLFEVDLDTYDEIRTVH